VEPGALRGAQHPVQGERIDAEKYDSERAERYARREGFY
jgi:hypothetical protein